MSEEIKGKITQIIGAVLDIKFPGGKLPDIYDAVHINTKQGTRLVVEVAQHLGDDTVRCIAMGPTDGLGCCSHRQPDHCAGRRGDPGEDIQCNRRCH